MRMGKRTLLLLTVVLAMLLACAGVVLAQTTTTPPETTSPETTTPTTSQSDAPKKTPKEKISGSYIVVLKDDADPDRVVEKKKQEIKDLKVKHVYKSALKGFAVEIADEEASKLRDNPEVKYVEQDQVMTAIAQDKKPKTSAKRKPGGGTTTPPPQQLPWGIKTIGADTSSTLAGNGSGDVSNVNVYVIDTGIDGSHTDLKVTKPAAYNAVDSTNYDCQGHGTHVAGTIAARDNSQDVVGAAPGAPVTGVKVLNCQGSGTTSGVIAGVDWVTANAIKPAIANMSLGGGFSQTLNEAVQRSAKDSGVFYSVAAGNDGGDACTKSPASAGAEKDASGTLRAANNGVMTTGATDSSNTEASFSNSGSCVDVYAPGVNILSTNMGGGTSTKSGTSMAAPHVAGTGALYLSKSANTSATSAVVEEALKTDAGRLMTNSGHKILYAANY
jgi:subtilisin family serine protease